MKRNHGILAFVIMSLLLSMFTYAATSIELTTGNFINVFGNLNLSGNNLVNAGNVSIRGNLSVDGNVSIGNALFVDSLNNKVGINTTSPAQTLTVAGTLNVTTPGSNLIFSPAGSRRPSIFVNSLGRVMIGTDTEVGHLLTINGSVGIRSHPTSTTGEAGITFQNGQGLQGFVGLEGNTGGNSITGGIPNATYISGGKGLMLGSEQTVYMTIITGGNVGIGTTGPIGLLHVGTAADSQVFVGASTDPGWGVAAVQLGNKVAVSSPTTSYGLFSFNRYRDAAGDNRYITTDSATALYLDANGFIFYASPSGTAGATLSAETPVLAATIGGNVGIGTANPASTLTITGNFSATGTKSAVVNTTYGMRKLYAMESPDIRFYDEGRAKLKNGIANITLDPIFVETVEPDYQVYLTPEAKTQGIYVAEKAKEFFIVKGFNPTSNIPFAWQISAVRKGYKDVRLDLERKEDLEITATIDETNKITDVNIFNNNLNNGQTSNALGKNENSSTKSITGNIVNEITKINNEKSANENQFTINSNEENEIISRIQEKTKLDKDKIKRAINFKRSEPKKEGYELEQAETAQSFGNIFYSGIELQKIGTITLVNETNTTKEVVKEAKVAKDFSFRAGDESNYNEMMVINATSYIVDIKGTLKAKSLETEHMSIINGSVIIRLG